MIRVFVATGQKWADHKPVLEYSIRKNASLPVEVNFIDPAEHGMQESGCTGFTNVRWAVPELAGYTGFAIYLDIDMLVLGDIANLYAYRRAGKFSCLRDGQTEVMVMDCSIRMVPKSRLHEFKKPQMLAMARPYLVPVIPARWNCADDVKDDTRLIHFTDLSRQPWFTPTRDDPATRVLKDYQCEVRHHNGRRKV